MKQIAILDPVIKEGNPLQQSLDKCKSAFKVIFLFAFCVNILMLITPLYSLQVLDRVIGSGNLSTLLMLSLIIGTIYLAYSLLQVARSYTMIRIGEWLDNNVSPVLFAHSISSSAQRLGIGASQVQRDFQTVKTFLTSAGLNSILDAPWSIAYIAVIFFIHPYIGWITVVGGIIIVSLAFLNAIATNQTLSEANEYSIRSLNQAEIANRNAEVVEAMGMINNVIKNWQQFSSQALAKQSIASYRNGVISNFARFLRNVMQMAVTGVGAYVVVTSSGKDMTTGGMIASSIMVGRALAPFDNAIELWKSISSVSKSYKRLNESFKHSTVRDKSMPLMDIKGQLTVDNIYYALPNPPSKNPLQMQSQSPRYVIKGVSFSIEAGEILAIIGPSAAGKSTLAKVITGVLPVMSGSVRLDGGDVYKWNREDFGKHVGYLPQGIELFSGSIKQNISRMADVELDGNMVQDAAILSGAHDMILKFSDGYETDIGTAGSNLSGGQRQRIGLARAFYGNPKLVILDEPNANLDEAGEQALSKALIEAKKRGISVVVISHRPSVLSVVDKIALIQDGTVAEFGSRDEVLNRIKSLNTPTVHNNNLDLK